jgi:hypothetical protein
VGLTDRFKPLPSKRGVYAQPGSTALKDINAGGNVVSFAVPPAAAAGGVR